VFKRINDGLGWRWLRVPPQLGTPWVLPALSAAFLVTGNRRGALVAAVALPVVKGLEVSTKKTRAQHLMVAARTPRPVGAGLGLLLALAAHVRVHQGAHHPTDTLDGPSWAGPSVDGALPG
jgi:hypothetical protein